MEKPNWKNAIEFKDITYKKSNGVARIAFNRPNVRNAFRPHTTSELIKAFYDAQEDTSIGVVLLSAEGPSTKDGIWSFCSGGDQKARGHQGYVGQDGQHRLNILEVQRMIRFMPKVVIAVVPGWAVGGGHSLHVVCDMTLASKEHAIFKQTDADVTSFDAGYGGDQKARGHQGYVGQDGQHRLNILEVQRMIRFMPKVVIAVVPGWAVGGGHSLHVVCDMTLASKEHAIFKQTDADVTSFDAGYGSAYLAKMVGQKKAREIFFLGRNYSAQEAFEMGMVNAVVPHEALENTAYQWAQEVLEKSPTSIKMLKFAMNLTDDGMVGQQVFAGEATRLAYMTDEAKEGRNAFLEKRKPNFGEDKWLP